MTAAIVLRDYQEKCLVKIREAWAVYTRIMVALATGLGKTVIFSHVAQEEVNRGGKVLILAHTDELLEQAIDKLHRATGIHAEKEKADERASPYAAVVVGSIQSLAREDRLRGYADNHFSLVIVDECFPSSTLIDGCPISEIRVGDFAKSFNHAEKKVEYRRVLSVFKKPVSSLVKITLQDGQEIICTPEHPFFSNETYTPAISIKPGSYILSDKYLRYVPDICPSSLQAHPTLEIVLPEVQNSEGKCEAGNSDGNVQMLRLKGGMHGEASELHKPSGNKRESSLLQSKVSGRRHDAGAQNNGPHTRRLEQEILFRSDEEKQSDEQSAERCKDGECHERPNISFSRRQWNTHEASDNAQESPWFRLGHGAPNSDSIGPFSIPVPSELIQARPCIYGFENCRRSGRSNAQSQKVEILGREEDGGLERIRVDRVEVLEPRSGGGFGEVCPDGFVYNIEIEGNNNYFADGVLVHNCHRSLAPSYQRVIKYFHYGEESLREDWIEPVPGEYTPKARILGVTATADRGDKRTLGEVFQQCVFEYGLLEAVRDGYLVRPIVKNIPLKFDMRGVRKTAGDYDSGEVSKRLVPFIHEIAKQFQLHCANHKTVVFTPSIDTARILAATTNAIGIESDFVSGACDDRREKIDRFEQRGKGSLIACAMLLSEGWDSPSASCICILRPTKIRSLYTQMVGRGTRTLPGTIDGLETAEQRLAAIAASGKDHMMIFDPLWIADRLDLIRPVDLVASKPEIRKLIEESGEGDLIAAEAAAERDLLKVLEKEAKKHANKKARTIDPIAWAVSLGDESLKAWRPDNKWDELPVDAEQIKVLTENGIAVTNSTPRGLAAKIIDRINSRKKLNLCSPKQFQLLLKFGINEKEASMYSVGRAGMQISRFFGGRKY